MSVRLDDVIHTAAFAENPFPVYRELQESDPVQWSKVWGCWVVTRYDDVRACLQDFRRFSNQGRITGLLRKRFDGKQLLELSPLIGHYSHGLINVDPPDHTRIRKLLHEVFKPSTIGRLAERVQAFVDELVHAHASKGRFDVVEDLAHPLPVRVIAELFGVPESDVGLFTAWSARIVEFMRSPQPSFETCLASQRALLEMRAYLSQAITERRTQGRDDVLSQMVKAETDGDRLTDDEILGTSVTILLGGHETTTRLMTTTVLELIRHPEQQEMLRLQPELMETAVEEFLRYNGPFHRDQRVALVDSSVGDKTIRKGDYLLLMLAAANRDPRQFPDPEFFDLKRKPNRHLAFGFGPHICLGAHLARLEIGIAIRTLLARCQQIYLESEAISWEFGFLRGPRELVIKFKN